MMKQKYGLLFPLFLLAYYMYLEIYLNLCTEVDWHNIFYVELHSEGFLSMVAN